MFSWAKSDTQSQRMVLDLDCIRLHFQRICLCLKGEGHDRLLAQACRVAYSSTGH